MDPVGRRPPERPGVRSRPPRAAAAAARATHGRSVWERPIDAASCPLVDLYVRDDTVDSGRVQPTPSGVPDPLNATGALTNWWDSPDVKVDAPQPNFQTPSPISDYVAFEAALVHRAAQRGRLNRVYVQVHNRGSDRATTIAVLSSGYVGWRMFALVTSPLRSSTDLAS